VSSPETVHEVADNGPRVTVIIPTYDRPFMAVDAARSALAQDPPPAVIVVDDGGPFPMPPDLQALEDQGLIRILHEKNRGTPGARNVGAREARSDYLVFLDDDDRLVPGSMSQLVAVLDARPDAVAVAGGGRRVFSDGRIGPVEWPPVERADFDEMTATCPFFTAAVVIRRSVFEALGGFEEKIKLSEDWDLWLRMTKVGPFVLARVRAVDYGVHATNQSVTSRVPRMAITTGETYMTRFTREERAKFGPGMVRYLIDLYGPQLPWYVRTALRRGQIRAALRDMWAIVRLARLGIRFPAGRTALRAAVREHLNS
jgi:hypothetical protein